MAIRLNNPIEGWHISENTLYGFSTVIDDSGQPPSPAYPLGLSTFKDNTIVPPWTISTREFSGGGKQFSSVQVPVGSALEPWSEVPRDGETLMLQNYLRSSEDLSATPWTAVGVTATAIQPDPYGTSRAFRLVRSGAVGSERIQQEIVLPSGWTLGSQMLVKFWAKAGTMVGAPAIVDVGIRDLNVPAFAGGLHTFSLTSTWKQYKFVVRGIDKTHLYRLVVYPAGTWVVPGDVYLFAPQVAEVDCDYLPTTTVSPDPSKTVPHALEDADAGNRFHKAVILTRMKTTSSAPGTGPSLSGETGLGSDEAREATLEDGSTDMAGVIQLKAGGAGGDLTAPGSNGQIHVAFSAPYRTSSKPLYTGRAPVVLASLVDSTSVWSAAAQVKVLSDASANGFTLKWDNGAVLTPSDTTASTYKISYVVIGR
ncbi:hypothetical protein WME97_33740 [Sorangium sp. So ce367]|uniref:hypothetical protein n=1 Tax=Sorangium sp. So ce367 TaxID=3133305 RepID=UPI003F607EBF